MEKDHTPPAVEPGAIVSRYQIVGRLGAGGMGEVYKAQDTVLGRSVALKILPPRLVRNDERMRRFVQEARSASSLNHPNIVTIYEIGQADGIHFIAMELIEGVTLKTRIHDQAAPLRTLLTHIAQAAEGLAKAHAAGIVHRDLKPDNIMVTADGFTKVLDFGLAKLTTSSDTDGATRTMAARDDTRDGVILGTVAYMSPEQVQGKTADHRSDIFALGTILYEAATRRRPFVADSDIEVMHKILHEKPELVGDLTPTVPAELRRTIRRCLAKEPERRFQSMKDVAIELSEIVEEFDQLSLASSSSASGSIAGGVAPVARPMSARTKAAIGLAATAALVALLAGGYQWQQSRGAASSPIAFDTMTIRPLTTSGTAFVVAISPDARYVAYVDRNARNEYSLWMRQVATGSNVRIAAEQQAPMTSLAFSPDGNYLYYTSVDNANANFQYSWLYSVPTLGGQPRKIAYDVDRAAVSPDGKQIAVARGVPSERQNHVLLINADGTGERRLTAFPRHWDAAKVAWSPDGRTLVTATAEMNPGWDVALMAIDAASGAARRIGTMRRFFVADPAFLPDGRAIVLSAADVESAREQIWLQPYPDGTPRRVTNDLSDYRGLALSADGAVIAALRADTKTSMALTAVDDTTGGLTLLPAGGGRLSDPAVAATGAVAYDVVTGNASDIAILDGPGAMPRVLTRGGENFDPAISGDGRTVVFVTESTTEPPHVFAINSDGSNLRQVTRGAGEQAPSLSADGRTLAYTRDRGAEVWVQSMDGGEAKRLSQRATSEPRLSRDGRLVAFLEWQGEAGGSVNLKIVPVDGGPALLERPWPRGLDFRWHPDGTRLTFRRLDKGVNNVYAVGVDSPTPVPITKFTSRRFSGYDWTADGKLVLIHTETTSDVVLITDWLRQR